ncbi:MAG: hypothetical protein P8N57_08325 [Flavobacteriaceae bacterium]|nr:hypothetical protein [Flavobacteriaceae bacterium]
MKQFLYLRMNKTTEKLRELKKRLDKEAEHFDNLIDILNSDKSKEKIIKDVKRELLLGQLKRNVIVTQEFAKLTANDVVLDAEGQKIVAYAEDVLKDVSQDNKKSHKLY